MNTKAKKEWVAGTPRVWMDHPFARGHCPGCGHPLSERMISEVIEEMGIQGQTIGVYGVGCGTFSINVINTDGISTAHGAPPAVASAIKRTLHGKPIVFTYQGDGDCIAIGAGPLINAVARAERITVIMVNNGNFGTTGGQMAPTTLLGQVTTTTPRGRDTSTGYPVHVPELLAPWKGVAYCARGSISSPANLQRTKRYLKTALQKQIDNVGFSFLEILSPCPPDWHLTPLESMKRIEEIVMAEFPLGEFKNIDSLE